jgi:hypothetical protein
VSCVATAAAACEASMVGWTGAAAVVAAGRVAFVLIVAGCLCDYAGLANLQARLLTACSMLAQAVYDS